jgi:hypothetical protein
LACADLAKLIGGKSHHQEKDGQKDRRGRGIIGDQPDTHEGARHGANYSHDSFEGDGSHELRAHQHQHGEDGPVVIRQPQELRAEQGEQTR